MKRFLRIFFLVLTVVLISTFPVFIAPIRSIWDEKKDHKAVAMQATEVEEEENEKL